MIRPAITFSYAIAGRTLSIQAFDEWAAALIRSFLRDFQLDPINEVETPDYTISISSQDVAPAVPEELSTFEVAYGRCATDGQRQYVSVEDSLIIVEADASLRVWVRKTPVARQPLSIVNLLGYVLEIFFRRSGLYQLHGAGLTPPGQQSGVLILGASGSGKSTLAALLASRGWSYMTDDALLLSEERDVIVARGNRKFFSASDATLASCSLLHREDALGGPVPSDPNKRRLEPAIAFPGRFIHSCVPGLLFFASITEEETSEVLPLTQAETMSLLIRSNPWASYDSFTAKDHLRVLNRLATQCRGYAFQGGLDLMSDASLAETLLLPLVEIPAKRVAK